jgi:ATPase family associated with various cellular activities (AAA)
VSSLPLFEPKENTAKAAEAKTTKPNKKKTRKIEKLLTDPSAPIEMRVEVLRQLSGSEDEAAAPILVRMIEAASSATGEDQYRDKIQELAALIQEMQQGPLRCALFDRMLNEPDLGRRAQVILPDSTLASPLVPSEELAEKLRCGDTVWIEAKGGAIIARAPTSAAVGEEAILDRILPDGTVRVKVGEIGYAVHRVGGRLEEQLAAGDAGPGSTLIVCPRRMMAFVALPKDDGLAHYEFLCREPVPNVVVERDIGSAPEFIGRLTRHLKRELTNPEVATRYRMRRSKLNLLSGIPGSGKTFGIEGFWNSMYSIVSDVTGVAVEDLPHRVMRLRSADVLSKWLGESDKNIGRFFKELEQLAAETFEAPDGRVWKLPVLVIAEEIDALARSRGEDGVHDRILASLLEGLDPGHRLFRDQLVFFVATTNTSHLVDLAMIRRIGGRIENFGHMDRFSFRSVLAKHIDGLPVQVKESESARAARERMIGDATSWLYGPNSNSGGQVDITFAGQANPTTKHHRDFLTAGLIDRAIQDASEEAANNEHEGVGLSGLHTALVVGAIHRQVRHIVDLLTPQNCDKYLTLPDGERVATVRRVTQPSVLPFELERAS